MPVDEAVPAADASVTEQDSAPEAVVRTITVPRLTEVVIGVMADLSSNDNARGETFPIRLLMPLVIDGVEVIPAGVEGIGEIVHAKRSGGMGAAGELLLTARYLEYQGQQIELRSFRMDAEAQSRIDTVNTINTASSVVLPLASFVGFFIQGGALRVANGTAAIARLTNDEELQLAAPEAAAEAGLQEAVPDAAAEVPVVSSDDAAAPANVSMEGEVE